MSAAIAPDTRKKELDRERTYRRAKKRSHFSDSVTIDALSENGKVPSSFESDFGAGVEKVIRDCERSLREEILAAARNRVKERKARTRRLIQEGAILEKLLPQISGMELDRLEPFLRSRLVVESGRTA